jgi:peroxiredoxin
VNDSRSSARAFIDRYDLAFPVAFDALGDVAVAYGVSGLPMTVLVSPSGRIVARHVGAISPSALVGQLHRLRAHR